MISFEIPMEIVLPVVGGLAYLVGGILSGRSIYKSECKYRRDNQIMCDPGAENAVGTAIFWPLIMPVVWLSTAVTKGISVKKV